MSSQLALNKTVLLSCFISHTLNKCPFHSLFSATFFFFAFLCFLLVILWFERAPKHSAEVLASAPKEGLKGCDESWGENICVRHTSFRHGL